MHVYSESSSPESSSSSSSSSDSSSKNSMKLAACFRTALAVFSSTPNFLAERSSSNHSRMYFSSHKSSSYKAFKIAAKILYASVLVSVAYNSKAFNKPLCFFSSSPTNLEMNAFFFLSCSGTGFSSSKIASIKK